MQSWLAEQLRVALGSTFTGEVVDDPTALTGYSHDASLFTIQPRMIVTPRTVADLTRLVQVVATERESGLTLTVRSGGTDMTGGPLTDSVVVDMQRYFNRLRSLAGATAVVQPGMWYRDFERATLQHNLLLPSFTASRDICTVGGMVANNSGGEKTLRYGKTERYVQQLKAVLRDGQEYTFGPLTAAELKAKQAQTDFEGLVYRELFALLDTHYERLQQARPTVSKNSSGYALWDVWDKAHGIFDLTKLFTGSQGTLGIVTEITFSLVQPQAHSQMLVLFLRSTEPLATAITRVLKYQPETFESYDDHTLKLALRFLPRLARQMKMKGLLQLLFSFLPELWLMLRGGLPRLVLLAEFTGDDEQEVQRWAQAARASLVGLPITCRLTRSSAETSKYWAVRHESFNLLRQHVKSKRTAPFIDDVVVRPEYLPKFLPHLKEIMDDYDITYTIAGHVGDGNFHIIPLMDPTRPDFMSIIEGLGERVYDLVLQFKGSLSGEHNDGLIRSHFLERMYGHEVYSLFEQVKKIFDPDNIFNPRKKVGADWQWAKQYIR